MGEEQPEAAPHQDLQETFATLSQSDRVEVTDEFVTDSEKDRVGIQIGTAGHIIEIRKGENQMRIKSEGHLQQQWVAGKNLLKLRKIESIPAGCKVEVKTKVECYYGGR